MDGQFEILDALKSALFVSINATIWTGRAKLDNADIPEAAKHMPPKDLASAGTIKLYNADELKKFRNFKVRAEAICSGSGMRINNGFLMSVDAYSALEDDLAATRAAWSSELDSFVLAYPQGADDWAKSCGEWESLVRAKQPAPSEIGKRFRFDWYTMAFAPALYGKADADQGNATMPMINGLANEALAELIEELKDLYDNSFVKASDPSGKAYGALSRIAGKAKALGFMNPEIARLAPILQSLATDKNHTLARLVLSRMADPQGVADILAINDGAGLDSLMSQPAQSAQPAQPAPQPPLNSINVLDSLGLF